VRGKGEGAAGPEARSPGPKASGKSCSRLVTRCKPSRPTIRIRRRGANSDSAWRQAPQGIRAVAVSVAMASASNSRAPSETAFTSAVLSAQIVSPKLAFSTLQPVNKRPSEASKAAPTRSFEYGL
jgi:hypothetical protein